MGLKERQIEVVLYMKEHGKRINRKYQKINLVSRRTASRNLKDMVIFNIDSSPFFGKHELCFNDL